MEEDEEQSSFKEAGHHVEESHAEVVHVSPISSCV